MPRISKVLNRKLNLDYGYLFDIQSEGELCDWFDIVRKSIAQKDFSDALKYVNGIGHANIVAQLSEMKGISVVDALVEMNTRIWEGMFSCLRDRKRIFVNSLGGYFSAHENFQVSETYECEKWVLPNEKFRVLQWPGGTHFYAKIGNQDVIVEGKQKWDTREEAEQAARKFMRFKSKQEKR